MFRKLFKFGKKGAKKLIKYGKKELKKAAPDLIRRGVNYGTRKLKLDKAPKFLQPIINEGVKYGENQMNRYVQGLGHPVKKPKRKKTFKLKYIY